MYNIVGYQTYDLVQGYNLYSPTFVKVGGEKNLDIQSMKLVGDSVTGGGANFICPLDENGMSGDLICWWTPDDGTGEEEGCWFDGDNWEKITGVTIKAGEGLYVYAEDEGLSFVIPSAIAK